MYTLKDVALPSTYGDPHRDGDADSAFALFMAHIRNWIRLGGSALDIEELFTLRGLPTDHNGWRNAHEHEHEVMLAIGAFFEGFARVAFDGYNGATRSAQQLGPFFMAAPAPVDPTTLPLNVAMDLGTDDADTVVGFQISGTHAYTPNGLNGFYSIADVNAEAEATVAEVGKHRFVLRPGFFSNTIPDAVDSDLRGVPWVDGIRISPIAAFFTFSGATGTPQPGEQLNFAPSTAVAIVTSPAYDDVSQASGSVPYRIVSGTPAATDTVTGATSGWTATVDAVVSSGLDESEEPLRRFSGGLETVFDGADAFNYLTMVDCSAIPAVGNTLALQSLDEGNPVFGAEITEVVSTSGVVPNLKAVVRVEMAGNQSPAFGYIAPLIPAGNGITGAFTAKRGWLGGGMISGSPYPNFPSTPILDDGLSTPAASAWTNEIISAAQWYCGGSMDILGTGTTRVQTPAPIRADSIGRVSSAAYVAAGFCELAARTDLGSPPNRLVRDAADDDVIRSLLVDGGLPHNGAAAGGHFVTTATIRYSGGNGTPPVVAEDLHQTPGSARFEVLTHTGDGVTGSLEVAYKEGAVNVGDTLVGQKSGASFTVAAHGIASPNNYTPALYPSSTSSIDFKALSPIGEYRLNFPREAYAALRMYHPGAVGNLFDAYIALTTTAQEEFRFAIPSKFNVGNAQKALFVHTVMANMHQIVTLNTEDGALYPNTLSTLTSVFGWMSNVVGTSLAVAQQLYAVDPTQHARMILESQLVASQHPWAFLWEGLSAQNLIARGVFLETDVASTPTVYGEKDVVLNVKIAAPDVKSGSITIRLPSMITAVGALYAPTTPATMANISGVGTSTLTFTFNHSGPLPTVGNVVTLAQITLRASGLTNQSPGRPVKAVVDVNALQTSSAVNIAGSTPGVGRGLTTSIQ